MPLQLLHRLTNTLHPLPRQDDEIPVGLDRAVYYVVEVIQLDLPDLAPGQQAIPAEPVIQITDPNGAGINGTVTFAWVVIPTPPPPGLPPDWDQFREGLRTENGYQNYFAQAAQQRLLTAASLPVEFSEFRKTGNHTSFLNLFVDLVSRLSPQDAANALRELIELSQRCNMPPAFLEALQALLEPPAS